MTEQHTPGPWMITREYQSPASIEARDTFGGALAKVYLTDPQTRRRTPEYLANARLIEGAPELLHLLARVESDWGELCDEDEEMNGGDCCDWIVQLLIDARPILAKIRGEA